MTLTKSTSRTGIITLNIVLLAVLVAAVLVPISDARQTSDSRYLALPSTASGIQTGVVYIMDTVQQEMVAVAWNHNKNRIMTLGYRNIASDAQSAVSAGD
jgi:hypothetical protein